MKEKKILIVNGHPAKKNLSLAIAKNYYDGAKQAGHDLKILNLTKLKFDPILRDYSKATPLEKDIKKSQRLILWADHIVFIFPVWWGTMPALLKGWLDRILIPGFAYKIDKNPNTPKKPLGGKTAQIIKTSGASNWRYLFLGQADNLVWKYGALNFIGIKLKKVTHFGKIRGNVSKEKLNYIIKKSIQLGKEAK